MLKKLNIVVVVFRKRDVTFLEVGISLVATSTACNMLVIETARGNACYFSINA